MVAALKNIDYEVNEAIFPRCIDEISIQYLKSYGQLENEISNYYKELQKI